MQLFGRLKPGVRSATHEHEMSTLLDGLGRNIRPPTQGSVRASCRSRYARPLPLRAVTEAIPLVRPSPWSIAGWCC